LFLETTKDSESWRGLSKSAKAVLPVIVAHINRETGLAFPSQTRLAGLTGLSRVSVSKAVKELREKLPEFHVTTKYYEGVPHNAYEYRVDPYKAVYIPMFAIRRYPDISLLAKSIYPALMFLSEPPKKVEFEQREYNVIKMLKKTVVGRVCGVRRDHIDEALRQLSEWRLIRIEKKRVLVTITPGPALRAVDRATTRRIPKKLFRRKP
jgi:hypothetical protein